MFCFENKADPQTGQSSKYSSEYVLIVIILVMFL